ncbi:MAG: plasmid pRiA4b ORF-3 family protein, partial [Lachnospiraceae bacterium]|nr:plasmid pRiA4b ORF-3 family protein [Lachnospiraceae bacterium]
MGNVTGVQVESVIASYAINHSILETAKETGISTVKVRKILITEGLWESDTSLKIGDLLKRGMTTEEIADTLYMSVKNVQAYMPYERGVYGGEEVSKDAIRADKYRNRMRKAAAMQVINSKGRELVSERTAEMQESKFIEFKKEEKRDRVLKLHLELDMKYVNEEEMQVLKKYGAVKNSISRDILVPSDITLHALNYAILRMFGW